MRAYLDNQAAESKALQDKLSLVESQLKDTSELSQSQQAKLKEYEQRISSLMEKVRFSDVNKLNLKDATVFIIHQCISLVCIVIIKSQFTSAT